MALSLLVGAAHAVQLTVPATVEECVYQNVEESNKLTGSYEVLAGGRMEVDALVRATLGEGLAEGSSARPPRGRTRGRGRSGDVQGRMAGEHRVDSRSSTFAARRSTTRSAPSCGVPSAAGTGTSPSSRR